MMNQATTPMTPTDSPADGPPAREVIVRPIARPVANLAPFAEQTDIAHRYFAARFQALNGNHD